MAERDKALSSKQMVETDRGRIHVRMDAHEGEPVVMVHGWPESSYCWIPVASRLSPRWKVIAPDLRGLGDSERTEDVSAYQKAELAQDMLTTLDALGVDRFHLVGHDWGGVVAQEMALAQPQRMRSLCLLNIPVITNSKGYRAGREKHAAKGGWYLWYQHFQQSPKLPEAMIPGNEGTWLEFFLRGVGGDNPDGGFPQDAFDEYVRMYRIPGTPGSAANLYRAMYQDVRRWKTLAGKRFPMPAMYLYGNRDPVIIPEYLNHVEEVFDSLEIHQTSASHFVQEEAPDFVAEHLERFLTAHS